MRTYGNNIAVAQFVFDHNKGVTKTVSGFVTSDRLTKALLPTKVLFDSEHFKAGQTVWFAGDILQHPATRAVNSVNGIDFIVLLESQVVVGE